MTEYEYIKKQDIEAMADTITEIVVTYLFQVAIQGIVDNYEYYRSEIRKSLEAEDFVTDESRGWRIHPKGYGEYVLGLLMDKVRQQQKELSNEITVIQNGENNKHIEVAEGATVTLNV